MSEFRIDQITNQSGSRGPDIAGITTFTGTSGMVMPSGPTEYRGGRGRGLFAGGLPSNQTLIDSVIISTTGNAIDFGDLNYGRAIKDVGCSSSTRGMWGGGYIVGTGDSNAIDYVTISSGGTAFDFGDLNVATLRDGGKACNSTRGVWAGGQVIPSTSPGTTALIQYVTMATLGNASNFGQLTIDRHDAQGVQSPTRGVFGSWRTKTPTTLNINTIDYITIATLGDALDFGDLVEVATANAPSSNSIRGIWGGGQSAVGNIIQYITIASTGNAQDFGDLTVTVKEAAGTSNSTRGLFAGGNPGSSPFLTDVISYITISTLGDAADFGDLTLARRQLSGLSDAHGGLGD